MSVYFYFSRKLAFYQVKQDTVIAGVLYKNCMYKFFTKMGQIDPGIIPLATVRLIQG